MPGRPLNQKKVPSAPRPNTEAKVLIKSGVPTVSEKVQGKRAAKNESARKKRRTTDVAPRKPGFISLGGGQTARTQSAVVSEWLDNDEALVAPPPSTKTTSRNTHVEVQSKGGEGVPEQQAEKTPTAGAVRPPAQATWVDPRVVPRCSGRQRWFRTVYREADV